MKIPIRNLFYLLCYAWDVLDRADDIQVGALRGQDLENLFAVVLATGVEQQLRRGLERNYLEFREDSKCIRGRVDFQETVKRALFRRKEAHVIGEELSADTLSNRIIKSTVRKLLSFSTLKPENHERLAGLYRVLGAVVDVRITSSSFYRVRLHSNNRGYRLLLNICEMVHRYALPDEVGVGMHFLDFTRDQDRMWKVFQLFVTNFYRRRQTRYTVRSEAFPWYLSDRHHSAPVFLPRLETDMVLADENRKIVIDTKYSIRPFVTRRGKTTLRSTHVNQMFAYMKNVEAQDHKERNVLGVLLYAAVEGSFRWDWTLFGYPLRVAAVDLSREWQEIEDQLLFVLDFGDICSPLGDRSKQGTFAG